MTWKMPVRPDKHGRRTTIDQRRERERESSTADTCRPGDALLNGHLGESY